MLFPFLPLHGLGSKTRRRVACRFVHTARDTVMPESSWGDGERDIYCPFPGDSKPGSDSFRGSVPFSAENQEVACAPFPQPCSAAGKEPGAPQSSAPPYGRRGTQSPGAAVGGWVGDQMTPKSLFAQGCLGEFPRLRGNGRGSAAGESGGSRAPGCWRLPRDGGVASPSSRL